MGGTERGSILTLFFSVHTRNLCSTLTFKAPHSSYLCEDIRINVVSRSTGQLIEAQKDLPGDCVCVPEAHYT